MTKQHRTITAPGLISVLSLVLDVQAFYCVSIYLCVCEKIWWLLFFSFRISVVFRSRMWLRESTSDTLMTESIQCQTRISERDWSRVWPFSQQHRALHFFFFFFKQILGCNPNNYTSHEIFFNRVALMPWHDHAIVTLSGYTWYTHTRAHACTRLKEIQVLERKDTQIAWIPVSRDASKTWTQTSRRSHEN